MVSHSRNADLISSTRDIYIDSLGDRVAGIDRNSVDNFTHNHIYNRLSLPIALFICVLEMSSVLPIRELVANRKYYARNKHRSTMGIVIEPSQTPLYASHPSYSCIPMR